MLRPLLLLLCLPFVLAAETVIDPARDRAIPVETHLPTDTNPCSKAAPCPVALLSAGYGVSHTDYQFLVKTLNRAGYLVITVGHELATILLFPSRGTYTKHAQKTGNEALIRWCLFTITLSQSSPPLILSISS